MPITTDSNRGFALVAALLMLLMLSAFSVAIVFMANSETQTHTTDLQNTQAYYIAEAGMEKMMVDLNNLFLSNQSPTVAQIQAVGATPPTLTGYSFPEYQVTVPNVSGNPTFTVRTISSGPSQGLMAQLLPITLATTGRASNGAEVRMTRDIEIALVPVFQFAAFSDTDLAYFPSQGFVSTGRVHTNGNLYLHTPSAQKIVFRSKVTAAGHVIRAEQMNRLDTASAGWTGEVLFPTASGGCNSDVAGANCRDLAESEGSYSAVPPNGSTISGWSSLSTNTYNSWVTSGSTGAKALTLPFVNGTLRPIEIIRRPPSGESASSAVGRSRLYNLAQVRVLLDDDKANLPGGAADAGNVWLENVNNGGSGPDYSNGVPVPSVANPTYFAEGTDTAVNTLIDAGWIRQPAAGGALVYGSGYRWPLLKGALRVEARQSNGSYVAVTREWLEQGFARGLAVPKVDTETTSANSVHPNAILIFQLQADRNADGDLTDAGESTTTWGSAGRFNWLPTNMYDSREGELRPSGTNGGCNVGGIMNTPELDVGNLKKWLAGTIGTTGTLVESSSQNGYILYFSDRRGMLPNGSGVQVGEYGFEDIINPASSSGVPDGGLQTAEDVNQNNTLDVYGRADLGDGFSVSAQGTDSTTYDVPTYRVSAAIARKNRVTGARHGLKLINGSRGNLPVQPDGTGGFTVAAENGVYIRGNYNASASGFGDPHAAAAVIADAVITLSNNWSDPNSFTNSTAPGSRIGTTTYHRCAIAAGKNRAFLKTDASWSSDLHIGTDGGMATFMRYLENWSGSSHYYLGSLVSLYFSQYNVAPHGLATASTYGAPNRVYDFDTDFLNPDLVPPGTPRFQDIVNLGYKQVFTP